MTKHSPFTATPQEDPARQLLNAHMKNAASSFDELLRSAPLSVELLSGAMSRFIQSLPPMPEGTSCKAGCSYCCHLRVGVSISEAIILFTWMVSVLSDQALELFKNRIFSTIKAGNTLTEEFWHTSQTPCPFLDIDGQNNCLVYAVRPFSCRAYHSTDLTACQNGFDEKKETQIPCFPLYRALTDMYSTLFIREMEQRGFHSYQVGLIKALELLFNNQTAIEDWFAKKDPFKTAKLKD